MDLLLYAAAILLILVTHSVLLKACFSIVAGIMTSLLFVVGHDACHQSLTSRRWLNRTIGTLAFLPSLHPYSLWELGHNRIHHIFTNRRGKDYVWEPLTHAEFTELPRFHKLKYRFFRTPVGHYWYYLFEIWWKKMFFPRPREVGAYTTEFVVDHVVVAMWLIAWPCAIVTMAWIVSGGTSNVGQLALAVLMCCVLPFVVFNLLFSSVIYLHHMHPKVGWTPGDEGDDSSRRQMLSSVHVVFPYYTNLVFHHIMEHPAHHLRPGIPLYHLESGQAALEVNFPEIVVHKWSPQSHVDVLARCKLFDLERRCWVGYDGIPTAEPTTATAFAERSGGDVEASLE